MMRKSVFKLWSVLILGILLFACTAMAKESVTVYTNWSQGDAEGMTKAFAKDHPDIEVNMFRAPIEELFATLDLEMQTGQLKADVVVFGDPMRAMMFKDNGWLAPLNLSPDTTKMIDKSFLDKDGLYVPYMVQPVVIQYNKKAVTKKPVYWKDILNPKYKGKIAMGDPKSTGMVHVPLWYITQYLVKKDSKNYGWNFFKQLVGLNPRLVDGHRTIRDLIATGEISIGIQTLDNCVKSVAEGEPTGYTYPKDGTPALWQAVGVMKGAKNLKNGQIFSEWLVSYNGQRAVNQNIGTLPVRKGVPISIGETIDQIAKHGPVVMVGADLTPQLRSTQTETFYKLKTSSSL